MAVSEDKKLFFVHVPKNAGTSVREALDMKTLGHRTWKYREDHYPDFVSFAIVRNPWDRFVSSFAYAKMEESMYHGEGKFTRYHPDFKFLREKSFIQGVLEFIRVRS